MSVYGTEWRERSYGLWLLELKAKGTQRVHMIGVLPWLIRWALHTGRRDFCPVVASLVGPVQNIFLTVHYFSLFVPIAQQAWQTAVLGRLSLGHTLHWHTFWPWFCSGYATESRDTDPLKISLSWSVARCKHFINNNTQILHRRLHAFNLHECLLLRRLGQNKAELNNQIIAGGEWLASTVKNRNAKF